MIKFAFYLIAGVIGFLLGGLTQSLNHGPIPEPQRTEVEIVEQKDSRPLETIKRRLYKRGEVLKSKVTGEQYLLLTDEEQGDDTVFARSLKDHYYSTIWVAEFARETL